jgi:hypothetical protein
MEFSIAYDTSCGTLKRFYGKMGFKKSALYKMSFLFIASNCVAYGTEL